MKPVPNAPDRLGSREGPEVDRRLAALLAADVVGFSRIMSLDEAGALAAVTRLLDTVIRPLVDAHRGRIVKLMGDGLLIEFPSAVGAVRCAVEWQRAISSDPIRYRIGVSLGDVIVQGDDIFGQGVNVAARLEAMAPPGGILVSAEIEAAAKGRLDVRFQDLGEHSLKNIDGPRRVFQLSGPGLSDPAPGETAALTPRDQGPSIAVLPFAGTPGNPESNQIAEGISEDIATALSKLSKITVVSHESTRTYRGRDVTLAQVGSDQNVRNVLRGSVRVGGNRLRISVQLHETETGRQIWAERYDRTLDDLFDLQDDITREVVTVLQVTLTDGEQARMRSSGTDSFEAWKLVIQLPELLFSHRSENMIEGRRIAEQALSLDPDYAAAWVWFGWSHFEEVFNGLSDAPDAALGQAEEAAERALALDETNLDTLALLVFVNLLRRRFDVAEDYARRGIQLAPSNSFMLAVAANVAQYRNQPAKMLRYLDQAIRLCPLPPAFYPGDVAWARYLDGDCTGTVKAANQSIAIDPDYLYSHLIKTCALAELGEGDAARASARHLLATAPHYSLAVFERSQPFEDDAVLQRHLKALSDAGLPA